MEGLTRDPSIECSCKMDLLLRLLLCCQSSIQGSHQQVIVSSLVFPNSYLSDQCCHQHLLQPVGFARSLHLTSSLLRFYLQCQMGLDCFASVSCSFITFAFHMSLHHSFPFCHQHSWARPASSFCHWSSFSSCFSQVFCPQTHCPFLWLGLPSDISFLLDFESSCPLFGPQLTA